MTVWHRFCTDHCTPLYATAPHCTPLYATAPHCTPLYATVRHCNTGKNADRNAGKTRIGARTGKRTSTRRKTPPERGCCTGRSAAVARLWRGCRNASEDFVAHGTTADELRMNCGTQPRTVSRCVEIYQVVIHPPTDTHCRALSRTAAHCVYGYVYVPYAWDTVARR
jgi:hypothetical protein